MRLSPELGAGTGKFYLERDVAEEQDWAEHIDVTFPAESEYP